jgi:hypothetical protein
MVLQNQENLRPVVVRNTSDTFSMGVEVVQITELMVLARYFSSLPDEGCRSSQLNRRRHQKKIHLHD